MTRRFMLMITSLSLAGCSALAPPVDMPPRAAPALDAPAQWHAPPPPDARQVALQQWWQQFDDPVLLALIEASQAASPTVAAAAARVEQARASSVAADAALGPLLNANASGRSGRDSVGAPIAGFATANLQAAWEIDLFGANQAGLDAASSRLQGAQAGWHDARISVAAEVAAAYNNLRGCEALVRQTEADSRSRNEVARLTDLATRSGLVAPANAALARASAAQGRSLLAGQRAACDLLVKSLVALSALDEATLRTRLAPGQATLPRPAGIAVPSVPGSALMQRPDLLSAERQVQAAAADTAQAQAQRYPRISIAGSVGPAMLRIENSTANGTLWTIGPLQISMPLFDGGARKANVVAARARYDEAVSVYRAAVRGAVREVEAALVALDSSLRRSAEIAVAVEGFEASYRATEARYRGGLSSLFELEDARRSLLLANSSLVDLQRDSVAAWINLYRALGGGWTAEDARVAGKSE